MRRFVEREIAPHVDAWDEAGAFPARTLRQGRRDRPDRPRLSRRIRRRRGRPLPAPRRDAGIRALRLGRTCGEPLQPHDRRAADPQSRLGRDEGARAAANPFRREDLRAGDHRTGRRFRRRQSADARAARGRSFRRQRQQDLHHLGHARRFHHGRSAHRRPGRRRRQPVADRGRYARPAAHRTQEDGLVGLRHRHALFRELPRPRRQPDRRGERGLSHHHAQFQRRAAEHGRVLHRLRAGLPRRGDRLRESSARPSASLSANTR